MRTLVTALLAAVVLCAAAPARAHIAEGTVALTVDETVPAATGTSASAGGVAMLELTSDLTIEYDVTVHDLTGAALAAHIHAGAPGVGGPIVFPLTKIDDATFQGETDPLTAAQVDTLFAGGFYVNVHTVTNPAGEVRGQIVGFSRVAGSCTCLDPSRKNFLKCVRRKIKELPKDMRRSREARALKRAAKKSSCGLTQTKKPLACCLPMNGLGDIVSGTLCAPVKKEGQCTKLGGTILQGQSCVPTNACFLPASPSGAFVD